MKAFKLRQQNGSIIILMLITLPFIIAVALYYTQLALTSSQVARLDQLHTEAQLAADAGADYSLEQIAQDATWSGTGSEVTLHSDSSLRTTYQASVTGDDKAKVIAITGRTYWPASSTTPRRTVSINVDLRPVSSGLFSIVSGEGGLVMSNSSKVVGGDVFVNGEVNMSNTAQIGLSTSPVNLKVADQACPVPPDSTYPRVCNSGEHGQPIIIGNSARIYGTVTATNQTDGSNMFSPGLVAGTAAPQALPSYDRASQKAAVTTTYTPTQANCVGNNGSITWPANLKITGDISIKNSCLITVTGNVWITGSLSLDQSSQLIVSNTLGSTRPVIMIDGSSGATFKNNSQLVANTSNTGIEIITFWSAASCSPDCSSVTGSDLYNSRGITTISLNNNGDAPNSIFYAYWSQVSVGQSGQIGALVGQTINLNNNGTITFGTAVGTGSVTWVVKGYRKA